MKAAFIESTGSPDVIRYGDLPTPAPKQGEVLVRIGAASLNPIDLYIRAGTVQMPLTFPFIPGCDLAGTVAGVGPGTTRFKPGPGMGFQPGVAWQAGRVGGIRRGP